jgi:uncharacterized sulfatase
MFTGLYPTAHQVTQSSHALGPDQPPLAEQLQAAGYETVGFCNNPLVGILNNGFKRGFDTFYNYGGAIPSMPGHSTRLPWPLNQALEKYTQLLRRLSYPIQNYFGHSDLAFRLSLNAWLTPVWSRLANFKGQNARSARDVTYFLAEREKRRRERPLFLFLNLMETHLPFWPPGEFVDRVAPYVRGSREARDVMRHWNREAYRWAAPLAEPLGELEAQVLSDMYDAEVAYQDDYLGPMFEVLARRAAAANTLTVIVADHGDSLGEHDFFGHAFTAYQELVHVPLVVHWPARVRAGATPAMPVSTRRIYHTLMEAAGAATRRPDQVETRGLSLLESIAGRDPERGEAYTEVHPPLNFARAVQARQPGLLERFRCLDLRRAVVRDGHKLITLADRPDELFDLDEDPMELVNRLVADAGLAGELQAALSQQVRLLEAQAKDLAAGQGVESEFDENLLRRLRGLGYLE